MILVAAPLTPSGRPVLQQGEVEVSLLDKVDLELQPDGGPVGQQAESYKKGYAILTNRRIIWVEAGGDNGQPVAPAPSPATSAGGAPGGVRAASLPLAAVVACYKKVQYSIKGAKIRLILEVYTDRQRQPVSASGFHTNVDLLGLRCRGPAPDTFKAQLEEQVRQAVAADAASAAAPQTPPPAGAMSSGGSLGGGCIASGGEPLNPHLPPLRVGLQRSPRTSEAPGGAGGISAGAAAPTGSSTLWGTGGLSRMGPGAQNRGAEGRPDPELLQQLVEMGFPRNRCARSLVATQNKGPQEAIDYLLAFGDQPGMDDPLEPPPAVRPAASPQPGAAPWATASPSLTAFDTPFHLYPPILPASGPPTGSHASPFMYPYSPKSSASAAMSPFGAVLYGGGGVSPAGTGSPTGAVTAPGVAMALQPFMQRQMSMRSYPHQYGSAPELGGSGGSSPSLSRLAAGPSESLDVGLEPRRTIGVAGIVKREQQKTAESGRAVEQAFRDLSALMSSAASMVALAEKFRGVLGVDTVGPMGTGGEDPLLMDLETQQQLIALGISSPVTRETAGARYHIELSRQLADFLATPLQRVGGLMSLPDVYCLFNRARGTELVSPDDLLQAAKLFTRAGVQGLRLRQLSSGVLVIQGPQHSEEQVCTKIAQLTTPPPPSKEGSSVPQPAHASSVLALPPLGPGLSVSDVALALGGISMTIASEHLLMAEARGVVCRDDGPEGLRFYRNFFRQDQLYPQAS